MTVSLLNAGFLSSFVRAGKVCELRQPEGNPSGRQLLKLNALGALAIVEPGQVDPVRKGDAAAAIDRLTRREGE